MRTRLAVFGQFLQVCANHILHVRELFLSTIPLILLCSVVISRVEHLRLGEAIYFSFVTALTIGYGDIHPETTIGRIVSVFIGFVGLILTGLTVAVLTRALADTVRQTREES
jgi:voltage-gated potassium channel